MLASEHPRALCALCLVHGGKRSFLEPSGEESLLWGEGRFQVVRGFGRREIVSSLPAVRQGPRGAVLAGR